MQRELMLFNGHLASHSESSITLPGSPHLYHEVDEWLVTVTL